MQTSSYYQTYMGKRMLTLKMVGGAVSASVVVYVVIGFVIASGGAFENDTPISPMMRPILIALAITAALISIMIRMFGLSFEQLEKAVGKTANIEKAARNPKTGAVDSELLQRLRSMPDAEQRLVGFISWYQVRYILMLAFNEAIVLFGLILAILFRSPMMSLPFAAVSLMFCATTVLHPRSALHTAERIAGKMG